MAVSDENKNGSFPKQRKDERGRVAALEHVERNKKTEKRSSRRFSLFCFYLRCFFRAVVYERSGMFHRPFRTGPTYNYAISERNIEMVQDCGRPRTTTADGPQDSDRLRFFFLIFCFSLNVSRPHCHQFRGKKTHSDQVLVNWQLLAKTFIYKM